LEQANVQQQIDSIELVHPELDAYRVHAAYENIALAISTCTD